MGRAVPSRTGGHCVSFSGVPDNKTSIFHRTILRYARWTELPYTLHARVDIWTRRVKSNAVFSGWVLIASLNFLQSRPRPPFSDTKVRLGQPQNHVSN